MAKKKAARPSRGPVATVSADDEVPVVGMREPCPCGSGRRYKACHGRSASAPLTGAARPFEGFASETDIVAMREIVPAATASLKLVGEHADRRVTLATVLPMAWPALVRADGEIMLGLQVNVGSGDASRDVADVLLSALDAEPGEPVALGRVTEASPRLQDIVDTSQRLDVQLYSDFEFWVDGAADVTDDVRASLERTKAYAHPTVRLDSVQSAYWTQMGEKEFVRWMHAAPEDAVLDGLARLHAAGDDSIGEGTRMIGMFRTLGLICPVWELPFDTGAAAIEEPLAALSARLDAAMANDAALTSDERRARSGLATRQVTLR